ncbi:MAG: bifunctional folylpolyglutamate synthase/dihydrofolate synthase [Lachnospiraceae bacterium]|nr:bifunctional folylpolyglutamate synthase/dihydrofolate synthase [Lachnospiraceae bacterium]
MTTFKEATQYILDIPKFAGKHTLEDTGRLLDEVTGGNVTSKVIHIAGTNGKGSVCAYLRAVLEQSGRTVGMFTSPHLVSIRERIMLGSEMISKEDFVRIFEQVKEVCHRPEFADKHPSFFEFVFLMAMVYFGEKQPDYIILETGLGGRLDATNSIKNPAICIITEIGFDHMQYLGDTLAEIAGEKAGIIKSSVPVVFFDKRPETTEVLQKAAEKTKSQTVIIKNANILNVNIGNKTIDFSLHTGYYKYDSLILATRALYQTENASLAVAAAHVLMGADGQITPEAVKEGLVRAYWPGRMEEVFPGVFLDGAHNEDGIEAFLQTVKASRCTGTRSLLFGVVADKQYRGMIDKIVKSQLFDRVAVTVLESDRSASLDTLREIWRQYNQVDLSFHESAEDAYQCLVSEKQEADEIYIAGSLYLIGQLKALMRSKPDD